MKTEQNNSSFAPTSFQKSDDTMASVTAGAYRIADNVADTDPAAGRKAAPAADRAAELAHRAVDDAAAAVAPVAEWLDGQTQELKATQKQLIENTRKYVAANPLTCLGYALAAGFLISRIVR
jgi:ElaB/YqjD/DUF883 family membrane-anchored ribosome-binding protein